MRCTRQSMCGLFSPNRQRHILKACLALNIAVSSAGVVVRTNFGINSLVRSGKPAEKRLLTANQTPRLMDDELRVTAMKLFRRLLIGILAIFLIGTMWLVGWATVRAQEATGRAVAVLQDNSVKREDGQLVFRPSSSTDRGLIYYPGGLVDPEAYAVTAQGIADAGYLLRVLPNL
jgi:hypothetical protein